MSYPLLGELGAFILIAFALGLDAFSVSLVMGLQAMRRTRMVMIACVVGFLHMVLPISGMVIGHFISLQMGSITIILSGVLLLFLGMQMLVGVFIPDKSYSPNPYGVGLWIIGFSVSLDSFSVGLSFGMSTLLSFMACMLFFIVSFLLTWLGLMIGGKVRGILGTYSELLSGSILFTFGLAVLFSSA